MDDEAATRERQNWRGARSGLEAATSDPSLRRHAHRMLWEVCQFLSDPDSALSHLHAALRENPLFSRPHIDTRPAERSVLLLAAPGDFQANLPLDRLFDDSTELHTLWITDPGKVLNDPQAWIPADLPAADCVFIAIAQDARHDLFLRAADALAAAIGLPSINQGARIARLSRAGAAELLCHLPHAVVPAHQLLAHGEAPGIAFPIIIRPLGSHAGRGLRRIANDAELASYLDQNGEVRQFTVAPFIDYRSEDGLWRKYRVIFVDGVPYPLHLAIHEDWAIWYYNAAMRDHEDRLAEEARFLRDLPAAFPDGAMLALREIASRVGLDYFGLDCSVLPDGRLLVFEVETGMIVQARGTASAAGPDPGADVRRAVERMIASRRAVPAPGRPALKR